MLLPWIVSLLRCREQRTNCWVLTMAKIFNLTSLKYCSCTFLWNTRISPLAVKKKSLFCKHWLCCIFDFKMTLKSVCCVGLRKDCRVIQSFRYIKVDWCIHPITHYTTNYPTVNSVLNLLVLQVMSCYVNYCCLMIVIVCWFDLIEI